MEYRIVYSDELYHHGVKGMKWGVRNEDKYAARSQKWAKREAGAKTKIGKRFAGYYRIENKYKGEKARSIRKANNGREILSQTYGYKNAARKKSKEAELSKLRSETSRTRLMKKYHSNAAYNAHQLSEHYSKAAKSSSTALGRMKYDAMNMANVPMKTAYRGRKTTVGIEFAKTILINAAG